MSIQMVPVLCHVRNCGASCGQGQVKHLVGEPSPVKDLPEVRVPGDVAHEAAVEWMHSRPSKAVQSKLHMLCCIPPRKTN